MEIQALLKQMTLEEKIGQICVPILQKGEITPEIAACIREYGVGMIRYCPNAEFDNASAVVGEPNPYLTAAGTAAFTSRLQELARETRNQIPLIIAVDQEGGTRNDVNRDGAMAYASHMCFGAADDPDLTYRVAKATAEEFAAMGINMVQAPIVDVFRYPGRRTMKAATFGESAEAVTLHARAMQRGFQDGGIIAMIKHFPGYGSLATDAHKGTARISKSLDALEREDLYPFRALMQEGVDGIMTGHVIVECLDRTYPATLSKTLIQGYLRDKLGYDGVIETDAMRMRAIQDNYGTGPAAVLAVAAGNDLVLLRGSMEHFLDGRSALLEAVRTGALPEETIDRAVARILRLKEEKGLFDNPFADPDRAGRIVGYAEHHALLRELAERSVSVLKRKAMPLDPDGAQRILAVSPIPQKLEAAMDKDQCPEILVRAVKARHAQTETLLTALEPAEAEIQRAVAMAANADAVVLGTCNAILYEGQRTLAKALQALGKPVIVVAMESPCDIDVLEQAEDYVCMYGCARDWAEAAADCVFGKNPGAGRLPVTLRNC